MAKSDSDGKSPERARPSRFGPAGAAERLARVDAGQPATAGAPPAGNEAANAESEPRLLFILSTERSGSTLLSMALGANPRHVAPPEMHLLSYATFEEWLDDYPSAVLSLRFLLASCGDVAEEAEIVARFRGWRTEDVYRWILKERLGTDKVFIDKTPKYARSRSVLQRLESLKPRYIWLVRHPLAVAASQISLRRDRRAGRKRGLMDRLKAPLRELRDAANRRKLLRQEVDYWRAVHANIEKFLDGVDPARWRRVSFERLVREPEAVLRQLCEWLGSDFRSEMLEPGEHVPREMRPELGDPKIYRRQRFDASAADAWKEEHGDDVLDDSDRALIRRWGVAS